MSKHKIQTKVWMYILPVHINMTVVDLHLRFSVYRIFHKKWVLNTLAWAYIMLSKFHEQWLTVKKLMSCEKTSTLSRIRKFNVVSHSWKFTSASSGTFMWMLWHRFYKSGNAIQVGGKKAISGGDDYKPQRQITAVRGDDQVCQKVVSGWSHEWMMLEICCATIWVGNVHKKAGGVG